MKKTSLEEGMIYGGRRPADWLLAHNIVRPEDVDTRHGWNGFRRFWISPEKKKEMEDGLRSASAAGVRSSGRTTQRSPRKRSNLSSARNSKAQRAGSQGRATCFSG